ncbi:MAG: SGNH/GDSL hydrolase family protein [Burkholderiales bacterium]|nr:MAG: SGNH/GDSL hydrolase family protein [Burkholderiales bacterium]
MRRIIFWAVALTAPAALLLVLIEIAVRIVAPPPMMYPRYVHSERFGHLFPSSSTIVEEVPGQWRFVYRTNEYGYRVPMPEISNCYELPNIVVLGDSNTFGLGVDDGHEYPSRLTTKMKGVASVINLGIGSFGLTHQIRAFYEFGLLFQPNVVVLQFAANDPDDNVYEKVTVLESGRFRFRRDGSMNSAMGRVKTWLSQSFLQQSALYNLARNRAYAMWRAKATDSDTAQHQLEKSTFHNSLLTAFAHDLEHRGIALVFFSVPGHLDEWPEIRDAVEDLHDRQLLHYVDSTHWFDGITDYGTPEGHPWGQKGHAVVAENLAKKLLPLVGQLPSNSRACGDSGLPL